MKILSNFSFEGDEGHEVLCFSGKFHDREYRSKNHPLSFENIQKRLPSGWEPDCVLFLYSGQLPIPDGLEECPYPTVALQDDWFGGVDYLPDNLRRFDYVFTDRAGVELFRRIGLEHVDYWPLFGHNPKRFRILPGVERIYDVTFAGNLNWNVHPQRLPWLRRMCLLDARYRIKLFYDVQGDDYVKVLNQSRIVFNRSIKGEMNLRCFEGPACGALLFLEEENREVAEFLEPGKEVVLYNDRNFEDLLRHYLAHQDECETIAKAGLEKIQRFSFPRLFDKLANMIQEKRLKAGKGRSGPRFYFSLQEHCNFVHKSLSLRGLSAKSLDAISDLMKRHCSHVHLLNDCSVFTVAVAQTGKDSSQQELMQLAYRSLRTALTQMPNYLTAKLNAGYVLVELEQFEEAFQCYEEIASATVVQPWESYRGVVLPFIYNFPFRTQWSTALANTAPAPQEMAKARHRCARFFATLQLGRLAAKMRETQKAFSLFCMANEIIPNQPLVLHHISQTIDLDHLDLKMTQLLSCAVKLVPFHQGIIKAYAQALYHGGHIEQGREFIENTLRFLGRLQDAPSAKSRIPYLVADYDSIQDVIEDLTQMKDFFNAVEEK